jgi:hypothetical protein
MGQESKKGRGINKERIKPVIPAIAAGLLVIGSIALLVDGFKDFDESMTSMENSVTNMEFILDDIDEEVIGIFGRLDNMEATLNRIEEKTLDLLELTP